VRRGEAAIPGRFGQEAVGDEVDEGAHLGRRIAVRQVDGIDAAELDRRLVQAELHQRAGAQIIGDDEGRLVDQTLSRDRGSAQRIAIVGAQIAGNANADFRPRAKRPAIGALLRQRVTLLEWIIRR
jgi:hypothetical protein